MGRGWAGTRGLAITPCWGPAAGSVAALCLRVPPLYPSQGVIARTRHVLLEEAWGLTPGWSQLYP